MEVVAVADVDDHHAGKTAERIKKAKGNDPQTARDYRPMLDRKDLDAVIEGSGPPRRSASSELTPRSRG